VMVLMVEDLEVDLWYGSKNEILLCYCSPNFFVLHNILVVIGLFKTDDIDVCILCDLTILVFACFLKYYGIFWQGKW
jgi:hypothetical protein